MKCIPKNELLLSNPPKYKCKNCGQVWSVEEPTPECKAVMEDKLKEKFFEKFHDSTTEHNDYKFTDESVKNIQNTMVSNIWQWIEANTIPKEDIAKVLSITSATELPNYIEENSYTVDDAIEGVQELLSHTNLGAGDFIPKDKVKEIVEIAFYAGRKHGIQMGIAGERLGAFAGDKNPYDHMSPIEIDAKEVESKQEIIKQHNLD